MIQLYVKLPSSIVANIASFINMLSNLTFTGQNVRDVALNNTIYFDVLHEFLKSLEGEYAVAYPDPITGMMTIGIGFNLDQAEAPNIINNVLGLNYNDVRNNGYPLNQTQLDTLFRVSLTGYGSFTGKAQILYDRLQTGGLLNHIFKAYELVALQSMAFDNANLVGSKLMAAIANNDEMGALSQIIEYSNLDNSPGISNRMLQTGGLFLGNPSAVHLTWRAYNKIKAANSDLQLVGGLPSRGLSIQNNEINYSGGNSIVTLPGGDDANLDTVSFGSTQGDTFNAIQDGN